MNILKTIPETYVDGPGLRYSIYVAGCEHYCPGCHNPEGWNFDTGTELSPTELNRIIDEIKANPMIDGITILGGEPLHPRNAPILVFLLRYLENLEKNVWVFTGYTFEELIAAENKDQLQCLAYIDTLVDGRYDESLKNPNLAFKGSENQRFIDAKKIFVSHHVEQVLNK